MKPGDNAPAPPVLRSGTQAFRPLSVPRRLAATVCGVLVVVFSVMIWLLPETGPLAVVPAVLCPWIWLYTLPLPLITPSRYSLTLQGRRGRIRRVQYKDIWVTAPQKGAEGYVLQMPSGWPRSLWVPDTPQVRSMVRRIQSCNATGHGETYMEEYRDVPDSALSLSTEGPPMADEARALSPAAATDQRAESDDA